MSGLVAIAALLGGIVPAVTAGAATTGTAAVRLPAVQAPQAALAQPGAGTSVYLPTLGDRISCASPTACLAVGSYVVGTSGSVLVPVAEALHGTAWKSVAVKAPKGATSTALTGVSCKAATYCLVVGEWGDKTGTTHPAAWTWNGTALTSVTPPPVGGFLIYNLTAVSCVAVKSCVAIGTAYGESSNNVQIIWSWNGKTWARKTATPPGKQGDALLTAAHCFSLTSCVVAGMTESLYGPSSESVVLATWNGKAFTPQQAGPVSLDFGLATDVWCFSPSHCVMTGINVSTGKTSTQTGFAEVWNGKSWTRHQVGRAEGVDVRRTVRCVLHLGHQLHRGRRCGHAEGQSRRRPVLQRDQVVGAQGAKRRQRPFLRLRGRELPEDRRLRGHRQLRPGVGGQRQAARRLLERLGLEAQGGMMRKIAISGLVAVAAVLGSAVPAVTASAATAGTRATTVPAVTARLATAAGPATLARPATVISADLAAMGDKISCASPTACLAVGAAGGENGPQVAVARALHAGAWRPVAVKAPAGAKDTALTAVSCKAATYCLVIGGYDDKAGSLHPAAWTWNGTALTPAAAPPLARRTRLNRWPPSPAWRSRAASRSGPPTPGAAPSSSSGRGTARSGR